MKKVIGLSVAAVMIFQSLALAQTNRTSELTQQAISEAQNSLSNLRSNLLLLDQTLEKTALAIESRDNSGGIMNGISITGASIGLGLSGLIALASMGKRHGSGIAILGLGIVAATATIVSNLTGGGSYLLKDDLKAADLEKVNADLEALEKEIKQLDSQNDRTVSLALQQLSHSIAAIRGSLAAYHQDESDTERTKVASHIGQFVGAALIVGATTIPNHGLKVLATGAAVMNAANLARIVSGLSSSQADVVLKEIESVRKSLALSASYLD